MQLNHKSDKSEAVGTYRNFGAVWKLFKASSVAVEHD